MPLISNSLQRGAPVPIDYTQLKTHLWSAADELRANSRLRSHEYSTPVLGLIFLRYADAKFDRV